MKKLLFLSSLFLLSCGAKNDFRYIEWREGESNAQIQELDKIELNSAPSLRSQTESLEIRTQQFQGLPIENSFVKKLRNKSGNEILVRASVTFEEQKLQKLKLEEFLKKKSTISSAVRTAFPLFQKHPPEKIEVFIAHHQGRYEPIWRVLYSDGQGQPWEVRLNAALRVLEVKKVGSGFHDTVALVFPKGPKQSSIQEVVLKGLNAQPTLSNSQLHVSSQADIKIVDAAIPLKFNPNDLRFDQVQVFYFLNESLNWFKKNLGVTIPFSLEAEVHVGAPQKTNATFYYQGKIRLGSGDGETYAHLAQDPSIVIHESVHALVEAVAQLPYEGEGGSLNEAFADFFTALQLNNPKLGEVAYLKGPYRRTLANNLTLSDKNGGLYNDSQIVSGTLWELTEKLGPDKGRQLASLTLNRLVPLSDLEDFGIRLQEVLPLVLRTSEEIELAQTIITARGFK